MPTICSRSHPVVAAGVHCYLLFDGHEPFIEPACDQVITYGHCRAVVILGNKMLSLLPNPREKLMLEIKTAKMRYDWAANAVANGEASPALQRYLIDAAEELHMLKGKGKLPATRAVP